MFILKSKSKNGVHIIPFIIASLLMSIVVISCGGCKVTKGMVEAESKGNAIDSLPKNEKVSQTSEKKYPYVIGNQTFLNDTTYIVEGIKFQGGKMIFPNGRVITKYDYPILKDLPLKFNKNPGENYGYYDLSKLSIDKKSKLLSNMEGYDPKKVKNYFQAIFSVRKFGPDEGENSGDGRIYLVTDMVIFEEIKRSEDDIMHRGIGRIGFMEIYNKKGEKLYEVKLDKFGSSDICITPDKKYIIINSDGPHGADEEVMENQGAITVLDHENYKIVDVILHHPQYIKERWGCGTNYVGLVSEIPDTDSLLHLKVSIDQKVVSTLKTNKEESYKFKSEKDGYFIHDDGRIINQTNKNFSQFNIVEWNRKISIKKLEKKIQNEE